MDSWLVTCLMPWPLSYVMLCCLLGTAGATMGVGAVPSDFFPV